MRNVQRLMMPCTTQLTYSPVVSLSPVTGSVWDACAPRCFGTILPVNPERCVERTVPHVL